LSATDLRFFKRQPVTTELRFNEIPPPGVDIYSTATVAASVSVSAMPDLTTRLGYVATIAAAVEVAMTPTLTAVYDNSVLRGPHLLARSAWEVAEPMPADTSAVHHVSSGEQAQVRNPLQAGLPYRAETGLAWAMTDRRKRPDVGLPWVEALRRGAVVRDAWGDLLRQPRPSIAAGWQRATSRPSSLFDGWQDRFRRPRPALNILWDDGQRLGRSLTAGFGPGLPQRLTLRAPWQEGRRPPPGISNHGTVTPPAHVPCYQPSTALRFWELASTVSLDLRFRCPHVDPGPGTGETIVIPILRAYIMVNDIALIRRENSLALPALALSINIDADSWTWGWSASLPAKYLDDVLPATPGAPVGFEAVVNGVHWYLMAEKVQRDRSFPKERIAISGRGISAELSADFAAKVSRTNIVDRTAQQLMDDALMINGVGIGWTLDFGLTDWLVPAGAWSHTGSHIEAVTRIAEAAGGYVQAHRTNKVLAIKPRYPVAPWNWSSVTPDFSIPAAFTTKEGVSWEKNPDYNAVWISGEGAGVLASVTRQGSAGDLVAPMVVDALNTHADAARQRGIAILGAAGRHEIMTLETPILSSVGIYPVGSFVQFNDGGDSRLGIVRSLAINAGKQVRQTIEVECHG
jgi:hypothetical protein